MASYDQSWDLTSIPTEILGSEWAKRIRPAAPRAKVMRPCPHCGKEFSAGVMRDHKPACANNPRRGLRGKVAIRSTIQHHPSCKCLRCKGGKA